VWTPDFNRGDAKRQLHREVELLRGLHHLNPVVIVDEGHLLDHEMLEEIRFMLKFKLVIRKSNGLDPGRS
jgi:hypothetical protein